MEKQNHFADLVEFILDKYAEIKLNPATSRESLPPYSRVDLLVPLPEEKLPLLKESPFFFFGEINLVQIKAFHDTLSRNDLVQAMGQLNLFATSETSKGKKAVLTILTTYFPHALLEEMKVYKFYGTDKPWLFRIQGEEEAYLFIVSRVDPEKEGYEVFLRDYLF